VPITPGNVAQVDELFKRIVEGEPGLDPATVLKLQKPCKGASRAIADVSIQRATTVDLITVELTKKRSNRQRDQQHHTFGRKHSSRKRSFLPISRSLGRSYLGSSLIYSGSQPRSQKHNERDRPRKARKYPGDYRFTGIPKVRGLKAKGLKVKSLKPKSLKPKQWRIPCLMSGLEAGELPYW